MDGWRFRDEWRDVGKGGWVDRWVDGWMDGWMGGCEFRVYGTAHISKFGM